MQVLVKKFDSNVFKVEDEIKSLIDENPWKKLSPAVRKDVSVYSRSYSQWCTVCGVTFKTKAPLDLTIYKELINPVFPSLIQRKFGKA
jgi:hypothetical protein